MTDNTSEGTDRVLVRSVIEAAIRIGLIGALAWWCFRIVGPFIAPAIWSIIFAVALYPLHKWLRKRLGGREGLTATVIVLVGIVILLVPVVLLSTSTIGSIEHIAVGLHEGTLTVPPPPEKVASWPVVGESLHTVWSQASKNLPAFVASKRKMLEPLAAWLLEQAKGMVFGTLAILLSLVIAGFLMAKARPTVAWASKLAERLAGENGTSIVDTAGATIRSVAQGVLGIAVVQSLLAGIGMLVVGVPGAGLWAGMVLLLAIVQLPPALVMLPVIVWVFTSSGIGAVGAIVFAVYGIAVSTSDAVLKPLFLGRGVAVPMPVVLVGAIGGMITSGIVGLFLGAVILALGYQLLLGWMEQGTEEESEPVPEEAQPSE